MYRGFLITRIENLLGKGKWCTPIAIVVSATVFGLAHFSWGPTGIVQTAFFGLALAICFIRFRRNLWLLVWTHVIMDTLLWVQRYMSG